MRKSRSVGSLSWAASHSRSHTGAQRGCTASILSNQPCPSSTRSRRVGDSLALHGKARTARLFEGSCRPRHAGGFLLQHGRAAIYMAITVLFTAHAPNIDLSLSQQL